MSENARVTVSTTASARRPSLLSRVVCAIPPEPPASPVRYSPLLIAYVTAMCALSIVLAVIAVHAPSDGVILAVGDVAIFGLVLLTVRSFGGVSAPWSPAAFVHLAVSFAFGAVGALTAALAASLALAIRLRTGWFRTVLNAASVFLVNLAAWSVYHAVAQGATSLWLIAGAGLAGGAASYAVNSVVLSGVIRLAQGVSIRTFWRSTLGVIPNDLLYGLGAAGFSAFVAKGGTPYLVMWLAPVASSQGFLVILARRTNAHVAERVQLLQRIISAADDERARIASNMHDGPTAELAGLAMLLDAAALKGPTDERASVLKDGAELSRGLARTLRKQIYELSPHDLNKPGRLRDELTSKLTPLAEGGVDVDAEVPDLVPLDRSGLELLHRVCVEALNNIRLHARASHAHIAIAVHETEVVLTIDDDGRGFAAQDIARKRDEGHFGTRFLDEKAKAAHGTFSISSKPGEGVHIRVALPVPVETRSATPP